MIALDITPQEIKTRTLSAEHLQAAVQALGSDGFVVLNDVVDPAHLDILREKMWQDVQDLIGREDAPYNWNSGNVQQNPPPFPPYLFRDVLLNDMVVAVTKAVLGPGVKNTFYSGNTALPSRERQPVHADCGHLWPNLEVAHPAHALVVNVPVVDISPQNGSTEIWPGTHRDTTIGAHHDIKVPPEALEKRRAVAAPLQPTIRRGGVLIRDMRLWHAGMPNLTDQPRPMIAMIHNIAWLETGNPLVFPAGTEEIFAGSDLQTCARFIEGPLDYIHASHGYEYQK